VLRRVKTFKDKAEKLWKYTVSGKQLKESFNYKVEKSERSNSMVYWSESF